MQQTNPWNADKPFPKEDLWPACGPIKNSMYRKASGLDSVGWWLYAAERYLAPALTNWEHLTPPERRNRSQSEFSGKEPRDYRCLILGSNEGLVERLLCQWGFVGEIVATDIAENALSRARAEAGRLGYTNIRHVKADLNSDSVSGEFVFVIAEGVLHHIENITHCLHMIRSVMPSHGILLAAEFAGPFRFQLPKEQVYWINHILRFLPRGVRFGLTGSAEDLLPAGDGDPYAPPSEDAIIAFDPSEAISGHVLDAALLSMFDVIERKELGGTLMTYLHEHLDYKLAGQQPYSQWTQLAIELESALIDRRVLNSDYVFYVLRKPGVRECKAAAITGTLTKREDNPLWNLESVGTVNEAWTSQSFEVLAHGTFAIRGWAVDHIARGVAGGVEISIDGSLYRGEYGKRRLDVARAHGLPAYVNSGYLFELKAEEFKVGPHTAFIRVVSNDRQTFWEVGPYVILVQ